jgi:hypothetical protein
VVIAVIIGALLYCRRIPRPASGEFHVNALAEANVASYNAQNVGPPSPPPQPNMGYFYDAPPVQPATHVYNMPSPPGHATATSVDFLLGTPSVVSAPSVASAGDQPSSMTSTSQGKNPNFNRAPSFNAEPLGDRNSPTQLSEEQSAYVQNMYGLGVPAPAIAAVVERMLQEGETPAENPTSYPNLRRGDTLASPPPSYAYR